MKSVFPNDTWGWDARVPVKVWTDDIELAAGSQIMHLSNLPFAFHHIAIMPDCHSGYGMPIGGVMATKGVVSPNCVGVDIGCGMCAVKTSIKVEQMDKDTLKKIMGKIREVVPVGFEHQKEEQDEKLMPEPFMGMDSTKIVAREYSSALKQLGTLGGGNHFIEIQKDTEGNVWVMIHSGSRNLGKKVADHYNKLAVELNQTWFSQVPKEWELAFLPINTEEADNYMAEMKYCVDFALANRKLMMNRILEVVRSVIPRFYTFDTDVDADRFFVAKGSAYFVQGDMINIAHNYAAWENHFGENVIVHRKGATLARGGRNDLGIIPGSQGTKSYIVRGLGNPDSFQSCSHGAGRKMGRNQAIKSLDLAVEQKKLDDQGIVHGIRNQKNLDEAAGAYKDISTVMENQKDLVEILVELSPMAVIKGD